MILKKSVLAVFTKFGMQDYGVSTLLGIAFGDCVASIYAGGLIGIALAFGIVVACRWLGAVGVQHHGVTLI